MAGSWPTIEIRPGVYPEELRIGRRVTLYGELGAPAPQLAGKGTDEPLYIYSTSQDSVFDGLLIQQLDNDNGFTGIRLNLNDGKPQNSLRQLHYSRKHRGQTEVRTKGGLP